MAQSELLDVPEEVLHYVPVDNTAATSFDDLKFPPATVPTNEGGYYNPLRLSIYPNPMLHRDCYEVPLPVTRPVIDLANNMFNFMYDTNGCGLAAPQVGVPIRLIVIDCEYGKTSLSRRDPHTLINPRIVEISETQMRSQEGCLSIPYTELVLNRYDYIRVQAYDLNGQLCEYEAENDLLCCCLQHEIDHIHGVTMADHLPSQQRLKFMREYVTQFDGAAPLR